MVDNINISKLQLHAGYELSITLRSVGIYQTAWMCSFVPTANVEKLLNYTLFVVRIGDGPL